jgi:hypothetical protein
MCSTMCLTTSQQRLTPPFELMAGYQKAVSSSSSVWMEEGKKVKNIQQAGFPDGHPL